MSGNDPDGWDPVRDTVGPGIYGGKVQRHNDGSVVYGTQYANHCKGPGPVYLCKGAGLTDWARAICENDTATLEKLFYENPSLVNDVATGGCTPLHFCGMSYQGQHATDTVLKFTPNLETEDTCGQLRPLHRMASNNLVKGAHSLLKAGADPNSTAGQNGPTPMRIAKESGAHDVVDVLAANGAKHV